MKKPSASKIEPNKSDSQKGSLQPGLKQREHELLFTYFNELNIISQLSTGIFERNLNDGLTASQFSVLNWFIRVDKVATPGRLATAFQVTRGAMTNTLKKLAVKKLISVEPDASSGRRKIVKITRKGRQVQKDAMKAMYPVLNEFSAAFDSEALKSQIVAIKAIRSYLDEYRYQNP